MMQSDALGVSLDSTVARNSTLKGANTLSIPFGTALVYRTITSRVVIL